MTTSGPQPYFPIFSSFFAFLASTAPQKLIEPHDELFGFYFEEIGSLKLITKIHELNFNIDLSNIREKLNFMSEISKNHKNFENFFELKNLEFSDLTQNFPHRQKRFIPDLGSDLQHMRNYANLISKLISDFESDHKNLKEINRKILTEIEEKFLEQTFHNFMAKVEKIFEAIFAMQTQNRLNEVLVSFEEFGKALGEISGKFLCLKWTTLISSVTLIFLKVTLNF